MTVRLWEGARRWTRLLFCAALLPTTAISQTQHSFPERPIKLLLNYPSDGPLEHLSRTLAAALQVQLNQPIVIELRPGAAGNVGADLVAKSPADGYTVLLTIDLPITLNPHLYAAMPFDSRDLRPLMIFSASGLVLGVHASSPATTLDEFIAQSRKQETAFASSGNGTPSHLAALVFADGTGARVLHVPYKGIPSGVAALLGGEVQAGILLPPGLRAPIQAGKVRPLAVTGARRSPLLPQVPTVAELGLRRLEVEVLYMAMVPTGTPAPVFAKLRDAMRTVVATPEFQARLTSLGMVNLGETGAAAAARLAASKARYEVIVRATGMKVD